MTDILIDNNKLHVINGDFQLTDNVEEIKQHIVVALNTLYGEWILNPDKGIDYAFGLRNTTVLENEVKKQISGVNNVLSISNFKLVYNRENLTIEISADIHTIYGQFFLEKTFKYPM